MKSFNSLRLRGIGTLWMDAASVVFASSSFCNMVNSYRSKFFYSRDGLVWKFLSSRETKKKSKLFSFLKLAERMMAYSYTAFKIYHMELKYEGVSKSFEPLAFSPFR